MKTYIKPNIEVTMVEVQPLMAGSNTLNSITGTGNTITMGEGEFSGGPTDSRGGSIWSDED